MYNNSDEHFLTMQSVIDVNRKDYDKKTKNLTEYLTAMVTSIMDQI